MLRVLPLPLRWQTAPELLCHCIAIPQDATGVAASHLATVISISVDTMLDYNKVCAGPGRAGPGLSRRRVRVCLQCRWSAHGFWRSAQWA